MQTKNCYVVLGLFVSILLSQQTVSVSNAPVSVHGNLIEQKNDDPSSYIRYNSEDYFDRTRQGGDTYDDYYMPNDGSPYPRDFIIDQDGIIQYANNEIDFEWMLYVINELVGPSYTLGDINFDNAIDILDVVLMVNIILGVLEPYEFQFLASDLNLDGVINVLDIVQIVNIILD